MNRHNTRIGLGLGSHGGGGGSSLPSSPLTSSSSSLPPILPTARGRSRSNCLNRTGQLSLRTSAVVDSCNSSAVASMSNLSRSGLLFSALTSSSVFTLPISEDEDFNYRFNSISFKGKEWWIVGKPAILLYTSDAGESWERIPLSAQLPGDMGYIKATAEKSAEMVTDQGAIYVTSNRGYNCKAAVQETVSATLNRWKIC